MAQGKALLLAISGGLDSMVMLHWLNSWHKSYPEYFPKIEVAHIHHGLRQAADIEAQLVEDFCHSQQLPFHIHHLAGLGLDGFPLQSSGGMEARARQARYHFLNAIRQKRGLDWICTAHHADDQVETLLLRIMRGTGVKGLAGVHPLRNDGIWRPLLAYPLEQLQQYAQKHGVPWREDQSNQSSQYMRNRLRHGLIPHLNQHFPQVAPQLLAVAQRAQSIRQKLHVDMHDWRISAQILTNPSPHPPLRNQVHLDLLSVFPSGEIDLEQLQIRSRQAGDLFAPLHLRTHRRKLKQFWQENGYPSFERDFLPLLAQGSTILWIATRVVSGLHKVTPQTQQILAISVEVATKN